MSWERKLQGTPGLIRVLHTHARCTDFHPHEHIVMPSAAIDTHKKLWGTKGKTKTKTKTKTKKSYLFDHKALAKVFRAKMLDTITQTDLELPRRYPTKWVVHCKSVGAGNKARP